jgi:hypothetical protein
MRQKVRALEEAVKQTIKGREDVEAEYALLEATRVEQEAELADALRRFKEARARAEEWRSRREKAEEETGNKLQGAKAELAAVEARLEKLNAKRERLEGPPGGPSEADGEDDNSGAPASGLVGELEAKLREMSLERERIEADPCGLFAVPSHYEEAEKSAGSDARAPGHFLQTLATLTVTRRAASAPLLLIRTNIPFSCTLTWPNSFLAHLCVDHTPVSYVTDEATPLGSVAVAVERDRLHGESPRPHLIHKQKSLPCLSTHHPSSLVPSRAKATVGGLISGPIEYNAV